jgi:formate dehydrogenase subunit delta
MDSQRLIHMVNQIARNFEHANDPAQATFEHIKDFWDPRMIAGLLSVETAALGPIAAAAVQQLARVYAPQAS